MSRQLDLQSRIHNLRGHAGTVLGNAPLIDPNPTDQGTSVESIADAVANAVMRSISTAVHRTESASYLQTAVNPSIRPSTRGSDEQHHDQSPISRSVFQQAAGVRHTSAECKRPRYEPPSMFERMRRRGNRRNREDTPTPLKTTHYVRDVILLPPHYKTSSAGDVLIPRTAKRRSLGGAGLVGKIEINSNMTEIEVRREICEVFSIPMGLTSDDIKNDNLFPITYLQRAGSGSRSLCVPSVKPTFEWNGKKVASLAKAGTYIYILADRDLPGYQRGVS